MALACAALLAPAPAGAVFHLARISEVMSGAAGNPAVQYVEIQMVDSLQNAVGGTRLTAFNCDGSSSQVLLLLDAFDTVPNEGPNIRWIMASPDGATFLAASGVQPDFTWSNAVTGSIAPTCGMVCWGAPGDTPPNPNSWSAGDPNNYTDCVAYGGYTGPRKTMAAFPDGPTAGAPTALPAGDGTFSLTRTGDTNDNASDFVLACPTPTSNAGTTGNFGPCTPPTTTTTVATTSTTTTLPAGTDLPLTGKQLLLRDNPNPQKRALAVSSRDTAITLGAGPGSADDPTAGGGSLRVRTAAGCGTGTQICDQTYGLPAVGWSVLGKPGKIKGYAYRDPDQVNGPIRSVVVKVGRRRVLAAKGKGSGLDAVLAADPSPVDVLVRTGAKRYCLRFPSAAKFKAGKRYVVTNAAAPAACLP